jgi:uncharacterized phage-associated protein
MVSVFDVVQYILTQQEAMTAMKLQKLCYYAQAWSLVWDEAPLFPEEIQAWVNGPVIPDLYAAHKGLYTVTKESFSQGDAKTLSAAQKETVDSVVEHYGVLNPHQLSALTHRESPWIEARKGLWSNERGSRIISHADLAEYYESKHDV